MVINNKYNVGDVIFTITHKDIIKMVVKEIKTTTYHNITVIKYKCVETIRGYHQKAKTIKESNMENTREGMIDLWSARQKTLPL